MKTDATYLSACVLSSLLWNLARKSFNMPLHWLVWAKRLYAKLFKSKETIGKQRIKISRIGLQPLPTSYISFITLASSKGIGMKVSYEVAKIAFFKFDLIWLILSLNKILCCSVLWNWEHSIKMRMVYFASFFPPKKRGIRGRIGASWI